MNKHTNVNGKPSKRTAARKARPELGTVEAALVPAGATERGLLRRIDALGKAILTGKVRPDVARLQITLISQQLQVMGFAYKAVDLGIKAAQVELERTKHESREAGRLRSAEIQVGTADPNGYSAIVRRLGGGHNGAAH